MVAADLTRPPPELPARPEDRVALYRDVEDETLLAVVDHIHFRVGRAIAQMGARAAKSGILRHPASRLDIEGIFGLRKDAAEAGKIARERGLAPSTSSHRMALAAAEGFASVTGVAPDADAAAARETRFVYQNPMAHEGWYERRRRERRNLLGKAAGEEKGLAYWVQESARRER